MRIIMGVLLSSSLGPGLSLVWKALLYISLRLSLYSLLTAHLLHKEQARDPDCIKQLMFLDLRPTDDQAACSLVQCSQHE